mmetsp:Transcript_16820/g.23405  ORF Transcript_16820/g.23405 Transcript_16820/m.23405 type:complete len:203 (+) Transcript_16820:171-779(+)
MFHFDSLVFKSSNSTISNFNSTIHNGLSGSHSSHSLLLLKHSTGNFRSIRELVELEGKNFSTSHFNFALQDFNKSLRDFSSFSLEACSLIMFGHVFVWVFTDNLFHDSLRLIEDEHAGVFNINGTSLGVDETVDHDTTHKKWISVSINHFGIWKVNADVSLAHSSHITSPAVCEMDTWSLFGSSVFSEIQDNDFFIFLDSVP